MAFAPPTLPFGCFAACHTSCSSPLPTFGQLPVSYSPLHASFLHYHFRASFLRFATSFNNVRFVPSFSISVGHSPPAANNFCVPFGLLRLRVCHTFCKEKRQQKRYAKPLRITELPNALRAILVSPLASARRLLPFPTPSASFWHASPSGGQVCHLGSTAFFGSRLFSLRRKKEEAVFFFSFYRV